MSAFLEGFTLAIDNRDGEGEAGGSFWDGPVEPTRMKCPLLWLSCGQQIGKFMFK